MALKKRTITLTGDNATGAGALTGVTGTGHASGTVGLGAAYAALRQLRAYGAAGDASGDILIVDADGVEIVGATAIDSSGSLGAETYFGSAASTALSASAVTGAGRGVRLIGVPFYGHGTQTEPLSSTTVTGSAPPLGHPIMRSPVTVYLDNIADAVVTVDLFVEV